MSSLTGPYIQAELSACKVELSVYAIVNYVSSIHIYTAVAGKDRKM